MRNGALFIEISRLSEVTDREHEYLRRVRMPPIPGDVGCRASADHEFAQTLFHPSPDQRVSRQDADPVAQILDHLERTLGIPDRDELEDPFEIGERPRRKPYGRHALARGLFTFSPRALAAR